MQYKIVVDKQPRTNPSSEKKEYIIDIEELRRLGDVYDTLTIELDKTYVTRRLQLSEYGVLSVLLEPIIENLDEVDIELFEGDNYVYLYDMQGNHFYAEYLIKNEFTDLYVTVNQMNSSITQSAQSIEFNVSQTLQEYSTTEEMNSAIQQTANSINLEVSKKVGDDEIISKINQSAEQVQINANKVSLKGKEISLTSDNITISSNNFNVDKNGNMICNNGNFSGIITGSKIIIGGSEENPMFIAQDNNSSTYIFPNGLVNEFNLTSKYAAIQNGGLGVGTISGNNVQSMGTFSADGIQNLGVYNMNSSSSANVRIDSAGYFYRATGSSKRWKKDITEEIEDRLNPKVLYNLKIKQYKYKDDYLNKNDKRYNVNILGIVAEDLLEVYEPAVEYDENGNVEMWNSEVLIPAILMLVQEQHKDIQQLQERLKKLEEKEENNG